MISKSDLWLIVLLIGLDGEDGIILRLLRRPGAIIVLLHVTAGLLRHDVGGVALQSLHNGSVVSVYMYFKFSLSCMGWKRVFK